MSGALNNNSSSNKKGSISFGENNLQSVLRMSGALNNNNDNNNDLIIEDTLEALERDYVTDKIAQMFKSEDLIKADAEVDEEDKKIFDSIKSEVNEGRFPSIIDEFFQEHKTPENKIFVNIKALMEKMFAEARAKSQNPFRYTYKPHSAWKDEMLSSPALIKEWYLKKNPGFLPIKQQNRKAISDIESKTEIHLETEDRNFVTKKKNEVAFYRKKLEEFRASDLKRQVEINKELGLDEKDSFAIRNHLRKLTKDLVRLVGSTVNVKAISDLVTQPDLTSLPISPATYSSCEKKLDPTKIERTKCESGSENSNDKSSPKIAGFYEWESKSLDKSFYDVIYVPEYDFLVMGMVKDLLLVQCFKKMPKPSDKQPKPVFNESDNANALRSKKLIDSVITDEMRRNALILLKKFESLIAGGYLYTEFIECLEKYLLFFTTGRLLAGSDDLRTLINLLKSLINTCFIILPTFEQTDFKKVLNLCAAPVLNLRLPNTRIYTHGNEVSIAFELYHDLLNHNFRTHQVTKYIPGYTGQYLGKILYLVKNEFSKFKYKYQPSKIKCIYEIISSRIKNLSEIYNYNDAKIKESEMTLENLRAALDSGDKLTEEEKYIFAVILFYLFHEMKNYCLHDLYFNKASILTTFESLLTRRGDDKKEVLESTRFFYGVLTANYHPKPSGKVGFMEIIFRANRDAVLEGKLDGDLRKLIVKSLEILQD